MKIEVKIIKKICLIVGYNTVAQFRISNTDPGCDLNTDLPGTGTLYRTPIIFSLERVGTGHATGTYPPSGYRYLGYGTDKVVGR